jgi:hypothetical protein
MPRRLAPVPRLDPVLVDIEPPELLRLPRTESWLPDVGRDDTDTGSACAAPVPAGAAATATGVGCAAGAMPHTSQKPSSMLPVQPGR